MSNGFRILGKKYQVVWKKAVRYGHNASRVLKKKIGTQVLWSELDENLLGEIMSRLGLTDQARFRAVCKRWNSARPITTYEPLPWLVRIKKYSTQSNSLTLNLYDQFSSPRLRISSYKISLSKLSIPYSLRNLICVTYKLKHGWLFFSCCHRNSSGDRTYFSLFSLLTRKYIQLPQVDNHLSMTSSGFIHTFSTNPNSPDCVFLISNTSDEPEFVIMTCRQGDNEWMVRKFDNFVPSLCIGDYINGTFYVVSAFGQVASYNTMNDEYEIEKLDTDDDLYQLRNSQREFIMFELNGELTVWYFSHDYIRQDSNTFPGLPCIKKFDRCTKTWVPLRTLGDQTILFGNGIYSFAMVGMEQARNIGVLLNAIYFYFEHRCIIYSFENGVLVQLKSNVASKNTVKSGDSLQLHYSSAIRDRRHFYFWMESPVI